MIAILSLKRKYLISGCSLTRFLTWHNQNEFAYFTSFVSLLKVSIMQVKNINRKLKNDKAADCFVLKESIILSIIL